MSIFDKPASGASTVSVAKPHGRPVLRDGPGLGSVDASQGARAFGRRSQLSKVALLPVVFFVGCAAERVLEVPPARAGSSPTRWEYVCRELCGDAEAQKTANAMGAAGFEFAGAASPAGGAADPPAPTWCFKRALPGFADDLVGERAHINHGLSAIGIPADNRTSRPKSWCAGRPRRSLVMLLGEACQGQNEPPAKDPSTVHDWHSIGPHVMVVLPDNDVAAFQGVNEDLSNAGDYVTSLNHSKSLLWVIPVAGAGERIRAYRPEGAAR